MTEVTPEGESLYPQYTMKFVTGDTWRRRVQINDPNPAYDPENPVPEIPPFIPRSLDGWSGRAQIRKGTKPTDSIIATLEVSEFTEDGYITLHLPPEESQKVLKESGWDLELTSPEGEVKTVLGGPVEPQGDYTK